MVYLQIVIFIKKKDPKLKNFESKNKINHDHCLILLKLF